MSNEQKAQEQPQGRQKAEQDAAAELNSLANKKPEELTPDELRLLADTMPGEGPGD